MRYPSSKLYHCSAWAVLSIGLPILLCLVSPCWPKETSDNPAKISLQAHNEPLKSLLARVSLASGYCITVNKEVENIPVTVELKSLSVYETVKRIVASIDGAGYTMKIDGKVIALAVFRRPTEPQTSMRSATGSSNADVQANDLSKIEVIPPTNEGEPGTTLGEAQALAESNPSPDPLTTEAIPPSKPGEKGITLAEVQAMASSEQEVDPYALEVIPSETNEESGLTLQDVQSLSKADESATFSNTEVIPPSEPGGKGITLEEVKAIEKTQGSPPTPSAQTLPMY